MKKLLPFLPLILVIIVTAILFIKVNFEGKNAGEYKFGDSPMVGKTLERFELELLYANNEKLTKKDFSNNYTVLNLFASWCLACLHEHQLLKKIENKSVKIYGISWRDKKEDTLDWLSKHGKPYNKVAIDPVGKFGISLGVTGIPETFLIDNNGKIIKHYRGSISATEIEYFNSLK
jgi:cytochrome c biogenesis protein CcmG/thiol:disulfide interchange protein DsbE